MIRSFGRSLGSSLDRLRQCVRPWLEGERGVFLAIFVLGTLLRVVARGSAPNGFNQDEAALGYDAWAILHYGVDRHGVPYPAFLIGWGSGMNALSAYFAMPFIAVFGLTEASVRSPNLLSGIWSIPVIYAVALRAADAKVALWAAFLFAICPWSIMASRWGLESNLLPGMFLLSVWLLLEGVYRPRFLLAAGISFALCLYAYGTAYFAVPVFLVLASVYLLWNRRIVWRWYAAGAAAFAGVATPIAAVIWVNQRHLDTFRLAGIGIPRMPTFARYTVVSSLFGEHPWRDLAGNLDNLWRLLVKQHDGRSWNAIDGHGLIYPFGVALALIGLLNELSSLRRARSFRPSVVMILWLVTAVALAAIQEGNINRDNLLWPPLVYFAAVGLRAVAWNRFVAGSLVVIHLMLLGSFAAQYFGSYRRRTNSAYFPGFGEAINAASEAVSGKICVTEHASWPYALILFYRRIDPRQFAATAVFYEDGEWQDVSSFDRYTIGLDECPQDTEAYVIDKANVQRFQGRTAPLGTFQSYTALLAKPKDKHK